MGARQLAWPRPHWLMLACLLLIGNWFIALRAWLLIWHADFLVGLIVMLLALVLAGAVLRLSTVVSLGIWLTSWGVAGPWLLAGVSPLLAFLPLPQLWLVAVWVGLGLLVYVGWLTISNEPDGLH